MKRIYEGEPTDQALKKLGDNIKTKRLKLGMSQRDLGFAVGCDHKTIGNYEHGRCGMNIHTLLNIAWALGYRLEELVSGIDRDD